MAGVRRLSRAIVLSGLIWWGTAPNIAQVSAQSERITPAGSNVVNVQSQFEFLNRTWEGTYICPQGLTSLKLVITAKSSNSIDAVFNFYAHPSNPSVPSGSFRMKGSYIASNSQNIPALLNLKGTTWIQQPSGWITVDLRGNVFVSEGKISGKVTTPGCSRFELTAQNQSPAQRLKEAAIEAAKAYPDDCKFSVADASKRMDINPPLPTILADKQVAYIRQKWRKVSIQQAINLARQGVFVVATATSSELQSTNAHVAVISPSKGITFPDKIEYPLVIGGALNPAASSIRSEHASNGEISIRYAFPKTLVVNGTVTYWTP